MMDYINEVLNENGGIRQLVFTSALECFKAINKVQQNTTSGDIEVEKASQIAESAVSGKNITKIFKFNKHIIKTHIASSTDGYELGILHPIENKRVWKIIAKV